MDGREGLAQEKEGLGEGQMERRGDERGRKGKRGVYHLGCWGIDAPELTSARRVQCQTLQVFSRLRDDDDTDVRLDGDSASPTISGFESTYESSPSRSSSSSSYTSWTDVGSGDMVPEQPSTPAAAAAAGDMSRFSRSR